MWHRELLGADVGVDFGFQKDRPLGSTDGDRAISLGYLHSKLKGPVTGTESCMLSELALPCPFVQLRWRESHRSCNDSILPNLAKLIGNALTIYIQPETLNAQAPSPCISSHPTESKHIRILS